jgi:hypothetical protein
MTWKGKYNALVDAQDPSEALEEPAYLVKTEEEDILRHFETDNYEVARCTIEILDGGEAIRGLTFRFVSE